MKPLKHKKIMPLSLKIILMLVVDLPNLYHLICGGGDPPTDEHVKLKGRPSVAVGFAGLIVGGEGSKSTVKSKDWACKIFPVLPSFIRHSKRPLSRS